MGFTSLVILQVYIFRRFFSREINFSMIRFIQKDTSNDFLEGWSRVRIFLFLVIEWIKPVLCCDANFTTDDCKIFSQWEELVLGSKGKTMKIVLLEDFHEDIAKVGVLNG